MELQYMQQLRDNPNLSGRIPLKGLDEERIQNIRNQFNDGKEFPKALEEYFVVGGESEATGMIYEYEDFEELREDCEESLENTGFRVERPFFVFDRLDSQYSIFFLDEEKEDPDIYIYILDAYAKKEENWPLYRDVKYTFSKMINDAIYRAKNNIPL